MDIYSVRTNWRETKYLVYWRIHQHDEDREYTDCWSHTEESVRIIHNYSLHQLIWMNCKWSNLLPLIVDMKEIQLIGIKEKTNPWRDPQEHVQNTSDNNKLNTIRFQTTAAAATYSSWGKHKSSSVYAALFKIFQTLSPPIFVVYWTINNNLH